MRETNSRQHQKTRQPPHRPHHHHHHQARRQQLGHLHATTRHTATPPATPPATPTAQPARAVSGTADTRPTPAVPLRALATGLVLLAWRPELVLDLLLILPRTTLEAAIGTLIDQLDRLDDADAEPEPQEA